MSKQGRWLLLALLLGLSGEGLAADSAMLKQAQDLMAQGNAKGAYELLIPKQSDYAGEVDYDYLLGIAALDAGHPTEAVFALERVLAVNPGHAQARAEIARAYYQMGELDASKQQLEMVQSQKPPAQVQASISKFLEAIEQAKSAERTTVRAYLEGALGYDTNVNAATSNVQVAIPAFGGAIATLSNTATKQHDEFYSLSGALNVRHMATPDHVIFAGGSFNRRFNFSTPQDQFNTGTLDGNVGLSIIKGDNVFTGAMQVQNFTVDEKDYRNADGFSFQWMRNLSQVSQFTAYAQYTDLTYPGQSPRDAGRTVLGAAYARALGGEYSPVVYIGGYAGDEKAKDDNFRYNGHDVYGVRLGGEMHYTDNATLFASLSYEDRRYRGIDPLFLDRRHDKQTDLNLGVNYVVAPKWTVKPQLSYTLNDSNWTLNDYDRTMVSVSVRRDLN